MKRKTQNCLKYFDCEDGNSIALNVKINIARINNKSKADFTFYASNNSTDQNIKYVDKIINPNISHPLRYHDVTDKIDEAIKKNNIPFTPLTIPVPTKKNKNPNIFTTACLDVLLKTYKLKADERYCLTINNGDGKQPYYKYSEELVTKIITLITEDKDVVIKNKKRSTPGA